MTAPQAKLPVSEAVLEIALDVWAETGRHSRWPVQGASMWPLLQPGDVVEVAHGKQGACPEAPPEFSEGCTAKGSGSATYWSIEPGSAWWCIAYCVGQETRGSWAAIIYRRPMR